MSEQTAREPSDMVNEAAESIAQRIIARENEYQANGLDQWELVKFLQEGLAMFILALEREREPKIEDTGKVSSEANNLVLAKRIAADLFEGVADNVIEHYCAQCGHCKGLVDRLEASLDDEDEEWPFAPVDTENE